MANTTPTDRLCPLCNGDNDCAMANGRPPESCWCQGVELNPDSLAAIPEDARGRRCICAKCGTEVVYSHIKESK